jgi:DNA-binding NarL/FixJ family response regulator
LNDNDTRKLRVILADDHHEVLEYLRQMLSICCEVVAAVSDGASAVAAVKELSPDVLVCDISMPGMSGFDVARELARMSPAVKVVFSTVHSEPAYVSAAFRAGASGYVLKASAATDLSAALRAVAAGESFVSPRLKDPR